MVIHLRSILESMRSRGRRLVAEDAERLFDMEQDDDIYCSSCGQYFALKCDEVKVKEEAKKNHYESEDHKRGGSQ